MSLFIVFEGGEGCGKTTQVRALARRLKRRGYPVRVVREPGGTPAGEMVRRLLKSGEPLSPVAELLLFGASRAMLVEQRIRPALQQGHIVVCDRFSPSTVAYQGAGRGLGWAVVDQVNRVATGGVDPTLTVLLDLPPQEGLRRIGAVQDRFEEETIAFHERVRKAYLDQANKAPASWLVLDGTRSVRQTGDAVWQRVRSLLKAPGGRRDGP